MDLTYYLRAIGRNWFFALIGLVLTVVMTVIFVAQQPFLYSSTGSMVVRPRTVDTDDGVRAIETLTRGVEISSTYATIARSDLILDRAKEQIGPEIDTSDVSISSEVVTSTSILEVTATGGSPEVVHALASEITRQTVAYVGQLQNVYELQVIDQPQVPTRPVAPNRTLLIGTGVIFGIAVGIVFALLAELVTRPARARRRYARSRVTRRDWLRSSGGKEPTYRSANGNADNGAAPLSTTPGSDARGRRSPTR